VKKYMAGLLLGLFTTTVIAATSTPSMEEMWAIIQQQQAEIEQLKAQLVSADEDIKETNVKVEATASMVEQGVAAGGTSLASKWTERTQIGGYGEMHYNNLDDNNDNGGDKDEEWFRIPAEVIDDSKVVATLPAGTTHYFINLIDENNFLRSYPKLPGQGSMGKTKYSAHALRAKP
jgi:hypothetical protein